MTRRGLLGLAGAAAIPARKDPSGPAMVADETSARLFGVLGHETAGPEVEVWHVQSCRGCGRAVCFLPRQRRNRCAWCQTIARRLRLT